MSTGTTCEQEEIERIFIGFAVQAQKQLPASFIKKRKKVIVLAGPTGCGKTEFGLQLAQQIDGEIISADSMQVYRGMDIGTAKATPEQRLKVPHHLIDIRDVSDNSNVVDFYYEARTSCQTILARGNVPIIVGGSGFYLHSLIYGPPAGPPSVPEVRKSIEEEMEKFGVEALFEKLVILDPAYAKTITKQDKQKIIRALEIMTLTGKKVSKISWVGRRRTQHYDWRCWFLHRPREEIYRRIEKRCDQMLEEGFLEEVKELEKQGLRQNPSASQAIGYRQALDYLQTSQSDADYRKFVDEFKKASRHYAKRQFTWFKKEPLFRWLDLSLHDYEVALDIVKKDYETL